MEIQIVVSWFLTLYCLIGGYLCFAENADSMILRNAAQKLPPDSYNLEYFSLKHVFVTFVEKEFKAFQF
jgi:hypothetical protein